MYLFFSPVKYRYDNVYDEEGNIVFTEKGNKRRKRVLVEQDPRFSEYGADKSSKRHRSQADELTFATLLKPLHVFRKVGPNRAIAYGYVFMVKFPLSLKIGDSCFPSSLVLYISASRDGANRHGQWRANEGVFEKHYLEDVQLDVMIANSGCANRVYYIPRADWSDSLPTGE